MRSLPTVTSDIPRDLRQFLDRVRENFGGRGEDELVTVRRLVAAGIAEYRGDTLAATAGETLYSTPPAPTNLAAEGALANVIVTWDKAVYGGHAYTEIWAAQQTAEQAAANPEQFPDLGEAELVGMAPGSVWVHNIGTGGKRWYWVRFVNYDGVAGAYNAVEGVVGETSLDPSYLLDVLTGAITQDQLYSELSTRVDRIDTKTRVFRQETAPEGTAANPLVDGDIWINTTVTYYDDYATGDYVIRANRMNRWDADAQEWVDFMDFGFQDWFTAINTEKTTRESADANLAQQITTVQAGVDSVGAQVVQEASARQSGDSANATLIGQLSATVTSNKSATDAAIATEQQARADADSALSQSITSLSATVATNYTTTNAAISQEASTRASEVAAVAQSVTNLSSVVDTNNATALAAIQAEAATRVTEDAALASDIQTIQADYVTSSGMSSAISAAISTEQTARAAADSAIASSVTTLEASVASDVSGLTSDVSGLTSDVSGLTSDIANLTAAVSTEASARVTADGEINAKYSVKIDLAGHVTGYGLIANANNGDPTSEFGIRADAFWVAPPTNTDANAPVENLYPGFVWKQNGTGTTQYWTGSTWSTTPQNLPFIVRSSPTTINGVSVPAGVYMEQAYIANGTITNAKIATAAIDDAKIANLDAGKITTGFLDAERIAANSITASMIDSRGLSIKDANGNIILAAGTPLAVGNVSGLGALATADNITMSSVTDAGSFATLSQITSTNVSTYIDSAAIKLANIDTATITTLASIKADMGTITAGKMQSTDGKFVIDLDNKTISIET